MNTFKRAMLLTMAGVMCLGAIGCGGKEDEGGLSKEEKANMTGINVMNFGGGLGRSWLDESIADFMELKKEESYHEGKKGVYFEIENSTSTQSISMKTSGYNIYFDVPTAPLSSYIGSENLLDISDIMDDPLETINGSEVTLNDKLEESMMFDFMGSDGKVYALPHYEFFGGLSYDRTSFVKNGFYFADAAEEAAIEHNCAIVGKKTKFVATKNAVKTVGNDGIRGTEDDGLPTTLEEFIMLCDYMKSKGVTPMTVAGGHIDYYSYLMVGLMSALAGEEEMKARYSFEGNVTVVDGYESEQLWTAPGLDIKKPKTKVVTLTGDLAEGYHTTNTLARYYAAAFTELAYAQGWFSGNASSNTASHTVTQSDFIFSGGSNEEVGMLIEGTYWYNESRNAEYFDLYKNNFSLDGSERDVPWMPLPTSYDVPTTENNGRKQVMLDQGGSYAFINANIADDEGLVRACKDFLKFLFTQEQIRTFVDETGSYKTCVKAEYQPALSDLTKLLEPQKSILSMRNANTVVYQRGNNEKAQSQHLGCNAEIMKPTIGKRYTCYYMAVKGKVTAKQIFEVGVKNSENW